jgi:hypothetical protein
MLKKTWPITLISVALITGCSTVTKETVNHLPATTPQISPTLMQPATPYKGLKRKVAIARFSNETRAGNRFLLAGTEDRIGKQASDILAARLTATGQFILLERADLGAVIAEQQLNQLQVSQVGADYLIIGSVSEYGRADKSETGVFSRNKIQTAQAKVNIRLVNVRTGQIIYSEEGSGDAVSEANSVFGVGANAGYDASLDDKALSAAISKLTSNLLENLMDLPWQAYLIGQQGVYYLMTGGANQGIQIGDVFNVVARGQSVKNPQTGLMIELPGKNIATLKVLSFAGEGDNQVSVCALNSGSIPKQGLESLVVKPASASR